MRKAWLLALAFSACGAQAVENAYPRVAAAYLVKRDGQVLWAGASERRLPPASLTKLMTALLVLEDGRLERMVTVSRAAARESGTRIGLREGDRLVMRDLLAATVIRSANDACRALADELGKSGAAFTALMNRRAKALGLRNTHFTDPCGHDRTGQFSTAADLASLAEAVMRHPDYLQLAKTARASIRTVDGARQFEFENTNVLLGRYPGVIGLKTGYTARAGQCLVALAERDGVRVLLVMLNAHKRWWVADAMLDDAFAASAR